MAAPNLDELDIIHPGTYAAHGYPHADFKVLRRESPVHWWERDVKFPFWAITRYEDIVWLSKQPKRFRNAPRFAVIAAGTENADEPPETDTDEPFIRQLLNMDPPEHGQYRRVSSGWFTPRAIGKRADEVASITQDLIDELGTEGETDFVRNVTAPLTIGVLADMLGVPREDWELLFRWTNQIAGPSDPEYQIPGKTPFETVRSAREEMFKYFAQLAQKRVADPREDMITVIAQGKVNGQSLPPLELLSYYFLLVVAGNETTRNAASGGLLALIENPGEFEKLQANPELIDSAVEEIVRWTAPVINFCRTPDEDFELRGQKIRAGENMCLLYPSANRDESVFPDGDVFRVDRDPNPHLGFGVGEHFCLGSHLARLELRVLFRLLAERVEHVELAGEYERVRSSFLGGVKRMPIRYKLRAS